MAGKKEDNKKKLGPPDKKTRQKNKDARAKAKLVDEILKGNELIVDNYLQYMEVLHEAAMGTLKGVSVTGQISSAKVLIEKAEKILKDEEASNQESNLDESYTPSEEVSEVAPLISLVPQKANEK